MNILLVYPEYPPTYWSFRYAVRFQRRKAAHPPLGLITISPLLPPDWNKRLVDLNTEPLRDRDLQWADMVFISAMIVQRKSANEVIARCHAMGKTVVAGGPYWAKDTANHENIDHVIVGEAEYLLPEFVRDYQNGCAKKVYSSSEMPDLKHTPMPEFDLIRMKNYSSMLLQFSRGCPFNCEFCDIIEIFGRRARCKTNDQFLGEVDCLYRKGWRGSTFIVDDNFIGNKGVIRKLLPELIRWQKEHKYPFNFLTEASVNLARETDMIDQMVEAGFRKVFLGIETPVQESLKLTQKVQNTTMDLVESVRKIQKAGLEVQSGFIVGFDSDPPDVFARVIDFIQKAAIPVSMVGLLSALPGTQLTRRLLKEGRLLMESNGSNTMADLNFIPVMNADKLVDGYKRILSTIYEPRQYYERVLEFLSHYKPRVRQRLTPEDVMAFFQSILKQGILESDRWHYWKFLVKAYHRNAEAFAEAVTLAIMGYHFKKVTELQIAYR
ncbi:MAG: B12-binding domain-containing radical SAM protein [Acidobacteria bacterium]|nr:MAG: B12-binding domain-containing radical SAM protein [Acidobacteriota bacterium]